MRGIFNAVYNSAVYNVFFTRYRFLTAKEVWTTSRSLLAIYLCVNAAVGIGFSCGTDTILSCGNDTLARAAGQAKRED